MNIVAPSGIELIRNSPKVTADFVFTFVFISKAEDSYTC